MKKGEQTRQKILDVAERAVLSKGFAATTIDEIRAEVGLTKSGFLYHYPDKDALAQALLQRYIDQDDALFDDIFARGAALHDDPLHAFLIGLQLLAETMANLEETHPGCLVATVAYQDRQFSRGIVALNQQALISWQARFHAMLTAAAERHPPKVDVNLLDLADMLSGTIEGGIILSKALGDKAKLANQIRLYRQFVSAIFLGTPIDH